MLPSLVWGSPEWFFPAALLSLLALVALLLGYWKATTSLGTRITAGLLKAMGILALAICLLEPLFNGTRPRPGANLFLLLADNSQSLQIRDAGEEKSRGELLKEILKQDSQWQTRLSQDFEVRRYSFATRLTALADHSELTLDGTASSLGTALETLTQRFRGRPVAGILLLTDGNTTDLKEAHLDWASMPPVYPVVLGKDVPTRDVSLNHVTVSQTNFEAAPVSVRADVITQGYSGEKIVSQLLDTSGKMLQEETLRVREDGKPLVFRFQVRPEKAGVSFYQLRVAAQSEVKYLDDPTNSPEATLLNNTRMVAVDRGSGIYRVLYVSGRPNWEFKFLRRAIQEDSQVELVGLIRVAKREPKFNFLGNSGEVNNPLYTGFGNQGDEEAEGYDQPVLVRIGTLGDLELRDGFPKTAEQLYRYHALILDDLEAAYFTQNQMFLIQKFVSQRGGGFLMLGGGGSLTKGKFQRTPIADLLPVYLDRLPETPSGVAYHLRLTREGWLQPWIRLRSTEEEEWRRLQSMPLFQTLDPVRSIKPGATVLAQVEVLEETVRKPRPALVAQRFGKGRVAALLIGDLWMWHMHRDADSEPDMEKAWRQTLRWLVADVPKRVEVGLQRSEEEPGLPLKIRVEVRDEKFEPLDNATVVAHITAPGGEQLELTADSSDQEAGVYETTYVPRQSGAYLAKVAVTGPDGDLVGEQEAGWAVEGAADEFRIIKPNRALLMRIARETGGELVQSGKIDSFVASLPNRKIPITESWTYPLWHHWSVVLFAILCLAGEWGLRRVKGLP